LHDEKEPEQSKTPPLNHRPPDFFASAPADRNASLLHINQNFLRPHVTALLALSKPLISFSGAAAKKKFPALLEISPGASANNLGIIIRQ
jgi:hypothetical protein